MTVATLWKSSSVAPVEKESGARSTHWETWAGRGARGQRECEARGAVRAPGCARALAVGHLPPLRLVPGRRADRGQKRSLQPDSTKRRFRGGNGRPLIFCVSLQMLCWLELVVDSSFLLRRRENAWRFAQLTPVIRPYDWCHYHVPPGHTRVTVESGHTSNGYWKRAY